MLWLYLNFDSLQLEALETSKDTAVIIVDPFSNQVTQANQVALTSGIKLNMGLAMAISITSNIEVVEYKEKIEQESLTNIANMLYRYTADISLDAPQGMFLRIDNMLRLYENLSAYWSTIIAQLNNLGFSYSYGAAPIALSAKLIALSKHNTLYDQSVLAQQYINSLPTDYLELTKAQKEQFHRVGFKRIGDVLAIPLKSLSKRFDLSVFTYLGQLSGQVKFPMSLFSPTLHYKRTLELLFEISNANILINPINKLLKELELFFRNRNLLSSQLKFTFLYRHNSGLTINVIAAGGEYKASVWLRLIKLQLESVKLLEPAVTISLECVGLEPQQSRTKDIFSDKMSQLESTQLHNKLIAKLSTGKVTRPTFIDSINPELVTKLNTDLCTKNSNLLVNHETAMQRPSFIQAKASKLVEPVKALHGPERILTGWWDGKSIYRDYFIAQNSQGQWLWIYRTPKQEWFVQGWFA